MAKNGQDKWGTSMRPGHRPATFDHLVSPIGEDPDETPVYSPSRTVNGSKGQRRGQVSVADEQGQGSGRPNGTYSAREQRRS